MEKTTRRWVTVALGGLLAIAVLGIAAVGGMVYFVTSNIHSEPASKAVMLERFSRQRDRVAGRDPLVQFRDYHEVVVHRPALDSPAGPPLQAVHVLVYDPRNERVTTIRIPFSVIRW